MSNTIGKTMTLPTLTPSGRKAFDLEMKEFYLQEIRWFYQFAKRNPKHAETVVEIMDNYKKLYESK